MANERLVDFPVKTFPSVGDIIYVGDSLDSYNEVKSTISQIIFGYSPALASIAGLTTSADQTIYLTAPSVYAVTSLTAFGRSLIACTNVNEAQDLLDLIPGVDIQPYSAALTSIAALTTSPDLMIYTTGSNVYATTSLTTFARTLLDDADAATMRTTLGLGTAATKAASDNTKSTLASISGAITTGHAAIFADTSGTLEDGGSVISTVLPSGEIIVGNASNVASNVTMSGDATLSNAGVLTLANSGVTAASYTINGVSFLNVDVKGRITSATNITVGSGPTGPAGGDLSGTYPNPTVAFIGGKAISLAGAFTTSGAFAVTQTYTGITNVTFPTTGTLATTSQLPSPAALTKTDDTNVTLTLGGSPSTALLQATSIAAGWTGQLGLTRGGSNASLTASNGGIVYSTASAMAILSGTATANQILLSGANTTPAWSTTTYPTTSVLGDIIYGSTANVLSKLSGNTTAVKQYLSQTGTGTVSAAPAWATISGADITGAALTKADDTNVTLTLAGSPSTALLNATSITAGWTGTLGVARGGTGAGTFTSNGVIYGNTTSALQVTAAGTTGQVFLGVTSGAPAWGNSLNGDFTYTSSTSGAVRGLTIAHTSNTSSSGVAVQQTVAGTSASSCYYRWANTGVPEGYACGYVPSTGKWQLSYAQSAGGTPSSDSVALILDKNQNFTYPLSTDFFTYLSGTVSNATGDTTTVTLQWGTKLWDYQTNIVSQTFTASTTAKYYHQVTILLSGLLATHTGYVLTFATSNRSYQVLASNPGVIRDTGNNLIINASVMADFDALDTATWTIEVSGGTKVVGFGGVSGSTQRTFWSGHIVG